jgi:hypothetical protein
MSQLSQFAGTTKLQYGQFITLISLKAQIDAFNTVFIVATLMVFFGAVLALFMENVKMKSNVQVHVE